MARLAQGRIVLWEGGGLWILRIPDPPPAKARTDFHAHHAIQITLALDGELSLHFADGSAPGPAVAVAADVSHAFEAKGLVGLLFVDPESTAGRALAGGRLAGAAFAALQPDEAGGLREGVLALDRDPAASDADWRERGQALIGALVGADAPPPADRRVELALARAGERLDTKFGIAEAAREAGLSPGRMSHLFVEQTGLPFRTYLLWLRMRRALDAYAHGASLTTAAHDAGFSDSAHFSRTFRRMFGVAAAEIRLA